MSTSDHGILQSEGYHRYGILLDHEFRRTFSDPKLYITSVVNREYLVSKLNDGVFHTILMRFANEDGGEKVYPEADMCAVFLGVYSMQHGATVPEHDIGILRSALKRADLPQEVKEQVEKALTHYKNNGDGWNFKNTSTGHNQYPNSSIPAHEMKKEDKDLQAFLKQQYAYQEKKAAMEKGSGTQDGVDHKEDEEDARATMK